VQNFLGIIPLALILGDVTEDLALRSGEVIGGLVNATFGNVVELILSCVALTKKKKALNSVAGLSNLGSILSNLLLVLGAAADRRGLLVASDLSDPVSSGRVSLLSCLRASSLMIPNVTTRSH
jgi:Ca2+:H+ antiporter